MAEKILKTGYEINGVDIGSQLEYARSPFVDNMANFSERGYENSINGPVNFSLKNIALHGSFPGTGLDINSHYGSSLSDFPPLLTKGNRPRLNKSTHNFSYAISGSSQGYYYYVSRNEKSLYIFKSSSKNSGYSLLHQRTIGDSVLNSAFVGNGISNISTTGSLEYSGIPKYLYVLMFGGGGGGGGGIWSSFAWVSNEYSHGGGGGSGGGLCIIKIPIGEYRSNFATRNSSTDYCFFVHNGGDGGPYKGYNVRGNNGGGRGKDTICYSPNGNEYATAVGGNGGRRNEQTSQPNAQPSKNTLFSANGGAGGYHSQAGGSLVIPESASIDGEAVTTHMTSVSGGTRWSTNTFAGGGGGGSRGNGGGGGGAVGYLGGGGRGGWGELFNADNGQRGGYGGIQFFY